ncbi:MAG: hypothetical protein ACREA2_18830, partial [Blastocatellia bacterium]
EKLPQTLYKIVRFESGDTHEKTERIGTTLAELYDKVEHTRDQTYHLMAGVVRQLGVNYDEPIMVCYLKPAFSDKPISNWMIKTSTNSTDERPHLVLNKQKVSMELADYAKIGADRVEMPLEMVNMNEVEILTGMKPGGINFLLEEKHCHHGFLVCLFQPDIMRMRPGETEYLGSKIEHNLDTAIVEVPIGRAGMNWSVLLDGSTFFWALTEIQKKYPHIKLLGNDNPGTGALRFELVQIAESLVQGLKEFEFNDQIPILNYFNSLEKHLERHIRSNHPYIQSDTVSVFIKEFIRNFLAVEGKILYDMIDVVLDQDLDAEEKIRELLYQFYRKFTKTEFAKNIIPLHFDIFIQKVCSDLFDLGFANEFILNTLQQGERSRKKIARHPPKKSNLDELLQYPKYEFSKETAKSEKYFALHMQIVDLLPRFIARSARKRRHPLLVFEEIQKDMIKCFNQRSQALEIGDAAITNMSKIFIHICFGKQIQLLDVIEDKLFVCGVSVRNALGTAGKLAPDLVRVFNQDRYSSLHDQRRRYMEYLLAKSKDEFDNHTDASFYQNKIYLLLLPDLENFLNLPMMQELFGTSATLYTRLTNVSDFERSMTADFDNGGGTVHVEGNLTLDYVKVRGIADINLATQEGKGHLEKVEAQVSA